MIALRQLVLFDNDCSSASIVATISVVEESDQLDELVLALLRAFRALVGVAAQSLAHLPEDVSLGQFRALVLLAEHGTMTVGALATHLGTHPSTTTVVFSIGSSPRRW